MLDALHSSLGTGATLAVLLFGLGVFLLWAPGIARLVTSESPTWSKVTGVLALGIMPPLVVLLWAGWWTHEALTCPPHRRDKCTKPMARLRRWYRLRVSPHVTGSR